MDIDLLKKEFDQTYGESVDDIQVFFAPGRINLIGDHTDYNGGYVLPCSLQYGTYLMVRLLEDPRIRFRSLNFPTTAQVCMKYEITPVGKTWINYPLGVLNEFHNKGLEIPGVALMYSGDIPNRAGLSSSASVEVVTAFALNEIMNAGLSKFELIKMSQRAENDFVGMNCGIMDQFAVTLGKQDHAVFLNCETLDYELVPVTLGDYNIIIANTNKRRELANSKYNERRTECEQALEILKSFKPIENLSGLNVEEFESLQNKIENTNLIKRTRHVISENQRVLDGVATLKKGDIELFGNYMVESHNSLKSDYEVSCFELDVLVEEALKIEGVLGSRMTGGGFGGCTISLVHFDQIETFKQEVGKNYKLKTGLEVDFYITEVGDGVKRMK